MFAANRMFGASRMLGAWHRRLLKPCTLSGKI
jgi:hypothetical protein